MPRRKRMREQFDPTDTLELEQELAVEKNRLRTSLEAIGHRASDTLDWRHHVRARPGEVLGTAAVVGVVVGVMVFRSAPADSRADSFDRPSSMRRGRAWSRLRAGLADMVVDRAILIARQFLYRTSRSTQRQQRRIP